MALSKAQRRKQRHERRRRNRDAHAIEAAGYASGFCFDGDVTVQAAEGEESGPPKFDLVAYNGGKMVPSGRTRPVVLDFAGMEFDETIPALLDHERNGGSIVGHGSPRVEGGKLLATGVVSGDGATDAARTVVEAAGNGFPWKTSVGASILAKPTFVPAGKWREVNGRRHDGPFDYLPKTKIREISFVSIAADNHTSAAIAATGGKTMDEYSPEFLAWLEEQGLIAEDLDENVIKAMASQWEAAQEKKTPPAKPPEKPDDVDAAAQAREDIAAVYDHAAAIDAVEGVTPEIKAQAVRENWDIDKVELVVLKAKLANAPLGNTGTQTMQMDQGVIECAMMLQEGVKASWLDESGEHWRDTNRYRGYKPDTIDAALGAGQYSFSRLFREFLAATGVSYPPGATIMELAPMVRDKTRELKASGTTGFSTISIPGILSNMLGKRMLAAFNTVRPVAQRVSSSRGVPDFKETKAFRITGSGDFLELTDTGELQHMALREEEYANRPKTFGRIISTSRQMLINDDLGALAAIPTILGRKAALKLQVEFFHMWVGLESSGFFSAGNANLISDPLAIPGLTVAETAFLSLEDADQDPIDVEPQTLLVPQDLKVPAEELMADTSTMIYDRSTTATKTTRGPVMNPHAGKWNVEWSPHLRKAATKLGDANGQTSWYMIAPPEVVAAAEIVYLNGRNTPTVEGEDADFRVLGFQHRGYFDFGVAPQDKRGALKSDGTGT